MRGGQGRVVGSVVAAAACSSLAAMVGAPVAASAGEEACSNFVATSAADGVRTGVASPGYLVVESADVQTPASQAYVDALGQSRAVAGAPYPGETAISLLPLAGVEPSSYPLAAMSQYPSQPRDQADNPAMKMRAISAARRSTGVAAVGSSAAGISSAQGLASVEGSSAFADAQCTGQGVVRSDAENSVQGLSVADGMVQIGAIHAEAQVSLVPGKKPQVQSELKASSFTVAGKQLTVTDKGLRVMDQGVALPANPVLAPLAQQGINIDYLAAERDPDGMGVMSPALRITVSREMTGTGPTEVTYTIGRSYARATFRAQEASSFPGSGGSPTPASVGGGGADTTVPEAAGPATASAGGAPTSAEPPSAPTAPAPVAAPPSNAEQVETVSFKPPDFSSKGLYLAVMGGGAALLLGGLIVRLFGVKLGWT